MKSTGSDVAGSKVQNVAGAAMVTHLLTASQVLRDRRGDTDKWNFSTSPFCRVDALCCDPVSSICCR